MNAESTACETMSPRYACTITLPGVVANSKRVTFV